MSMKIPNDPLGIEPATFQFVTQSKLFYTVVHKTVLKFITKQLLI